MVKGIYLLRVASSEALMAELLIVGGLMMFAWEGFGIGRAILVEITGKSYTELYEPSTTLTCLSVLLFAFVGLVIPGMMLKKQSL